MKTKPAKPAADRERTDRIEQVAGMLKPAAGLPQPTPAAMRKAIDREALRRHAQGRY